MHTIMIVVGGLVLLGAFLLVGYFAKGRELTAIARAAKIFNPIWFVISLINMSVGVLSAGYTIVQELPFLLVVFGIPAAAAWFISHRYSASPS